MRFKAEQCHSANNGIYIAIRLLAPIKEQFPIADFYQLLVLLLLKLLVDQIFHSIPEVRISLSQGRLPDVTRGFGHLRDVFGKQMGLTDKEDNVVMSRGQTQGSCRKKRSGFE